MGRIRLPPELKRYGYTITLPYLTLQQLKMEGITKKEVSKAFNAAIELIRLERQGLNFYPTDVKERMEIITGKLQEALKENEKLKKELEK